MTSRLLRLAAAVLVYGGVALSLPERSDATRQEEPVRAATAPQADRVLWTESGRWTRNLHVRSSRVDGGGVRRVYDRLRGSTSALVPSPDGRQVAFVTCCRDVRPLLVVAPTTGGPALAPLADHPELEGVRGLGWSPDGQRLAFTALVAEGEDLVASLWTVRLDGSDLEHVLTVGDVLGEEPLGLTGETTAWTRAGIFYTQGDALRLARDGTSEVVMRRVHGVSTSMDGRWLVLQRQRGLVSQTWVARTDLSRARKVLQWDLDGSRWAYRGVVANRDGSRLLAQRQDVRAGGPHHWIAWDTTNGPRSHEVLPVPEDTSVVAWQ
ncbi:WD40-like Beta Propeller Repeat [Nocardioides exalbidus]|uniref:WD40-like Beta Propeller Repeat n=2 Tax=Nocardioides exalbidus TaxID=402596 RepID=A0A1H4VK73_9ACTN|nr:WD40-like Beta Propeller Repeat [Nocardioides exalbidus]